MKTINDNQAEYMKLLSEYEELCWKINFKDYVNETQLKRLQKKRDSLQNEWDFESYIKKEKRCYSKTKDGMKIITINTPTPEEAKAKIKEISEHINKMFSNTDLD